MNKDNISAVTETKPELCRIFSLKGIEADYIKFILMVIENSNNHFGFLLAKNYVDKERSFVIEDVNYFRAGKNPLKLSYQDVNIIRKDNLFIVKTKDNNILPLPSLIPYTLCEIMESEYSRLKINLDSNDKVIPKDGVEEVVNILSKKTDFGKEKRGFLGFKRSVLKTPTGYADQEKRWYDMSERLRSYAAL